MQDDSDDPRGFEQLECWKAARELRLFVYREVLPRLPRDERFMMASQIRRAARSITANIAEGHGRFHFRDATKFCIIARGSCSEVVDHLITCVDEELIPEALLPEGRKRANDARRLINGYIRYLKRRAKEEEGEKRRETSDELMS